MPALARRREEAIDQVATQARALGSQALVIPSDLTDPLQIDWMAQAVLAQWGQVDWLILSQGQYIHGSDHEISAADLEKSLQVNFTTCFHAVQTALPGMLERRCGHVIFISSLIAKKDLLTISLTRSQSMP